MATLGNTWYSKLNNRHDQVLHHTGVVIITTNFTSTNVSNWIARFQAASDAKASGDMRQAASKFSYCADIAKSWAKTQRGWEDRAELASQNAWECAINSRDGIITTSAGKVA
jgi:hypothetical protein